MSTLALAFPSLDRPFSRGGILPVIEAFARLVLVKPGKPRVLREKWTKETLGGLLTGVS